MNVLITGGAGYIGSELARKLSGNSEVSKIIVLDNLARRNYNFFTSLKPIENKITFTEGDLLDSRRIKGILKDINIVFHLAALTDKNPSLDSHLFEQVNHWGTSELMNAIEESNVSKIIFTSSTSIYGGGHGMYTEDSIPDPKTFYATSKWRGEEQVKRLYRKKSCIIVRLANVYGYGAAMRFDGVLNKFMFDVNFKGRISIHGNGRQIRSFIHVDAVVKALEKLIFNELPSGAYNLTDKNLQILDIVEALQEIYPQMEFIFINQHLKIEDLQIQREGKLSALVDLQETSLTDELKEFRTKFSF